jgi:hypothetical protein
VPVVEEITGVKPLGNFRLPGFQRTKPTVVEDQKALAEAIGSEGAEKIAGQVKFDQQLLVFFQWAGSGQDKLAHAVERAGDKSVIVFTFTPGRTRDLRPHAHLYSVRKGVAWSMAK